MLELKIMVFLFSLAVIDVFREAFAFFLAFRQDRKLEISLTRKILLFASLAFISTIIATGFTL